MNVRELIAHLTEAAESLPEGLDSPVRLHLCNGHDAEGVLTKELTVYGGRSMAIVAGHPHLDDEDTVRRPAAMGVDDELALLAAGDAPPAAGITVDLGGGRGFRIPYDPDGRPLMPGAPASVDAGCLCDPGRNNQGRGHHNEDDDTVALVVNDQCPVHPPIAVSDRDEL